MNIKGIKYVLMFYGVVGYLLLSAILSLTVDARFSLMIFCPLVIGITLALYYEGSEEDETK